MTQSGDGGWHFFAYAPDGATASAIAVAWERSFYSALQDRGPGVSPFLEASLSQVEDLPILRKVSMGGYIFSGALNGAMLLAFLLLFLDRKEESIE